MAENDQTIRRVHYFSGKLLSAQDFQAEQDYYRERLRRHNRLLHGSGVVLGLQVEVAGQGQVVVQPGAALDCQGNELVLAEPVLCQLPGQGKRVYVCLCFAEQLADPVPHLESGVESESLAYTWIIEGVQVELLPRNPARQHRTDDALPGCDEAHPLALARILRKAAGWKLDKTFRLQLACPPGRNQKSVRTRKKKTA